MKLCQNFKKIKRAKLILVKVLGTTLSEELTNMLDIFFLRLQRKTIIIAFQDIIIIGTILWPEKKKIPLQDIIIIWTRFWPVALNMS